MTLIKPQLRCTEAGLLTFESGQSTFIDSDVRERLLKLGHEFLPINTETVNDVTKIEIDLRNESFLEKVAEGPGIPFEIVLSASLIESLMTLDNREGVDPIVEIRDFDSRSVVGGVHRHMQKFLCGGGVTPGVARSVIDVMSLVHGAETNRESLEAFAADDNFYRGGSFILWVGDETIRAYEKADTRMLSWPTFHLETQGDSTTYGYVSRAYVDLRDMGMLYEQTCSNVDDPLHALSLAVGIARLADAAASYDGSVNIFSDDFRAEV